MKVLIVGAGNIGRRHLQGTIFSHTHPEITIVDKDKKALSAARTLIDEAIHKEGWKGGTPKIHYEGNLPDGKFDVGIIATNSKDRRAVIDKTKKKIKVFILEKFLFWDKKDYFIRWDGNSVFVNCPRRAMASYQQFKGQVITVYYGDLSGMLGNAIHFVDLMCYLAGSDDIQFEITLDRSYKSKRKGYWDSAGRIVAMTTDHGPSGLCYLKSSRDNDRPVYGINDQEIDEERETIRRLDQQTEHFPFMVQSQLTGKYLDDISQTGKCGLVDYDRSAVWHLQFIEALRGAGWKKPIT